MKNNKVLILFAAVFALLLGGCDTNIIADVNQTMPARNWSYANRVKVTVDIKDSNKAYHIYFKLRHTSDYRYSNIFVWLNVKAAQKKRSRRYEFKLAEPDGQWKGSGSGNLYTYEFPLLTHFKFPAPGKYELELEQNMRDNPLKEVSDAGIKVAIAQ
uniref:gliding motility lipoprotein GldH n=1 Tax=Pedobacter schmidteae TaxID=2201271 RepID=UPI000EAEBC07|nr:gliding motility lipoprotein GldH [Pedobacter schmidteae]